MSNYIGVRCPVCNKKFAEADDIVVCPVCGAPHHRDCYMDTNQCAFVQDHLAGKEWSDPAGQVPPESEQSTADTRRCLRCGSANSQENIFCQSCGNPLGISEPKTEGQSAQNWSFPGFQIEVDTISMAYGGLSPEEEIEGETVRDIARYVGNGSAYYLPRFQLMSNSHRSVTMNLSAFLFNFFYYFNRKMYLIGGFLLALSIISLIPWYLCIWEALPYAMYTAGMGPVAELDYAVLDHLTQLSQITRTINFCIGIVASMFANRYYFTRTIADVAAIRKDREEKGESDQEYGEKLERRGGCNRKAVIAVAVSLIVAWLISLFVLSILYISTMQL